MAPWFHRVAMVLATVLAVLPALHAIPGFGPWLNMATTLLSVAIALATNLEKVLGAQLPPVQ